MKKIVSILLSVALVLCVVSLPIASSATENSGYILGDADGDGEVTAIDVTWIQRSLAFMAVTSTYNEKAADVDGDGEVSAIDATWIQRYLALMTVPYAIEEPVEIEITDPTFIVDSINAAKGETVTVAVNVKNNPGILGMTLSLSYDSSALTLKNAVSGSAISDTLAFTKPGRFTSPCNFTWDGLEVSDSQIRDGEILILTFDLASNVEDGVYPILLSYEEDSIFDKNLTPVNFEIINGSVTVGNPVIEPTTAPEPTEPATEAPVTGSSFVVDNVSASAGDTITVAVNVQDNPGILGMTLTLSYNSSVLTLKNAVNGSAVSDYLSFTKPGKFTSPCNFAWDGLEMTDDQIKDGDILVLTFDVASGAQEGVYPITLSYEEDSIFDKNLTPVDFNIINGSITVGNPVVGPTTAPDPTEPATEAPVTGPALIVDNATAGAGETVTVAVNIQENPGILGMTLTLSYNSSALTLTNAVNGNAVSDVLALTKPGKLISPCNFTWDGLELTKDQIKDGEILILTFRVADNASVGKYPITLSYEEDNIINADLQPIDVNIVNGSVTVK